MDGVVVTGTDARVGVTLVAAALVRGRPGATYVKPVQTGLASVPPDAEVVRDLTGCEVRQGRGFEAHLPPAAAATQAGVILRRADLLAPFHGVSTAVAEGSGGLLVDLGSDGTTLADLAVDLGLPLVVVCRPDPGAANHVRLTLEAAWARGIPVLGVVLNACPAEPDLAVRTLMEELRGMTTVLAVVPVLAHRGHGDLPVISW